MVKFSRNLVLLDTKFRRNLVRLVAGRVQFFGKIGDFLYEFSAKIGSAGKVDNVQFLEKVGYFEDFEFCGKIPDIDSLIAKVHYYN